MAPEMIYLDHAATTPTDPRAVAAMLPYFSERFGNPSSIYRLGRSSLEALDEARESVAELIGAKRKEIVFTSGGSEADNLAVKGVAFAQREAGRGNHVITSAIEHHAVLHAVEYLERFGFEISVLPVDATGLISLDDLRAAIRPTTVLVSIMAANNEVGTIQPIAEIGAICRKHDVLFHTDAVQAFGKMPVNFGLLGVDMMTIAAHNETNAEQIFKLNGYAIIEQPQAKLVFEPPTLQFENLLQGTTSHTTQTVMVKNVGTQSWQNNPQLIQKPDWLVINPQDITLEMGIKKPLELSLSDKAQHLSALIYTGELILSDGNSEVHLPLSLELCHPDISIAPSQLTLINRSLPQNQLSLIHI